LSEESLCFVIILKGDNQTRMISCLREIIARKSKVVVLSNDCKSFESDHNNIQSIVNISSSNEFNAGLSSILFFQLLSVEAAYLLGNNTVFPRSLAKSVTVG
jgi:glucosamine 6-phosphate synthetase-like amidotransferase/phosphosugar isomerase protein